MLLIVKENALEQAEEKFRGTEINISLERKVGLGAPLGKRTFAESFVRNKVEKWVIEVKRLSTIAKSQPHAANAALTHGVMVRWTYLMRLVHLTQHIRNCTTWLHSCTDEHCVHTSKRGGEDKAMACVTGTW